MVVVAVRGLTAVSASEDEVESDIHLTTIPGASYHISPPLPVVCT